MPLFDVNNLKEIEENQTDSQNSFSSIEKIRDELERFEESTRGMFPLRNTASSISPTDSGNPFNDDITIHNEDMVSENHLSQFTFLNEMGPYLLEYAQICNLRRHSV